MRKNLLREHNCNFSKPQDAHCMGLLRVRSSAQHTDADALSLFWPSILDGQHAFDQQIRRRRWLLSALEKQKATFEGRRRPTLQMIHVPINLSVPLSPNYPWPGKGNNRKVPQIDLSDRDRCEGRSREETTIQEEQPSSLGSFPFLVGSKRPILGGGRERVNTAKLLRKQRG